jgi:hypothetical protein
LIRDFLIRKLSRRSGGQAAVELVITLPVLLLVTAAVCQVAIGLNCYLVVTGASREGARKGAVTGDASAARSAALRACGGLPGGKPEVEVSFPQGRAMGKPVQVTITYTMPLLLPGLGKLVPRATFRGSTGMALERDP